MRMLTPPLILQGVKMRNYAIIFDAPLRRPRFEME